MKRAIAIVVLASAAHAEPRVELPVLHSFPGIDIVQSSNEGIHSHGGPGAKLDHANVIFEVRDARAHTIAVRKIAILWTDCDAKPDSKSLALQGHALHSWDENKRIAKGRASVSTPAGGPQRYRLAIEYKQIETFRGCGYAIDIVVDRVRKQIQLPLRITRESD